MYITAREVLLYTDEIRRRWESWFHSNGDELLAVPVAGDEAHTVGRLIMHIFGTELQFVERLRGEAITEHRSLPASSVETIFGFGLKSRQTMRDFISGLTTDDWARTTSVPGTVRKVVFHVLFHELRHWAQISRLLRERGFVPPDDQDLLMSSAME